MWKQATDFIDTDVIPYSPVKGSPTQHEKILARDPETGAYTRFIMSQPDLDESIRSYDSPSNRMLIHEGQWEEAYQYQGMKIDTRLNQTFGEGYFCCRTPGMKHGPMFHPVGAIAYEMKFPEHFWNKPELECFDTEVLPWKSVENSPGKYEKILCEDTEGRGVTRLVLNEPDLHACIQDYHNPRNEVLVYDDMWVEILILKGTVVDPNLNRTYRRGYYGCFAPGTKLGPYFYPTGATWIETAYRLLGD